jgi:hypothetical protein
MKFAGYCSTEEGKVVSVLIQCAMKIYGGGEIQFHAVLTSTMDGDV